MSIIKNIHQRALCILSREIYQMEMCQSLEPQTSCPLKLFPLKQSGNGWLCGECESMCFQETDFAIKTVQKWSNEHPLKTRQSEFLKMFPNTILFAQFTNRTVLNLCPKDLDYDFLCNTSDKSCLDCKIDYWLSEVE